MCRRVTFLIVFRPTCARAEPPPLSLRYHRAGISPRMPLVTRYGRRSRSARIPASDRSIRNFEGFPREFERIATISSSRRACREKRVANIWNIQNARGTRFFSFGNRISSIASIESIRKSAVRRKLKFTSPSCPPLFQQCVKVRLPNRADRVHLRRRRVSARARARVEL